ncbi:MAG: pyridoxal phosphate-dependent aminotransferase [Propionibacteriaceae bacterium]|jgi:cystathionine beta-lyase|nr:pyridoxal phosphate-dependent aminotransferase [Propionibacteriaceae bacterium]
MFDFDTVLDRRGTNSVKWDVAAGELPMWVADMDFATAPAITAAVADKARSGIFGYGTVPAAYGEAIAAWWGGRYGWTVDPEWVVFCDGIVPAVSSFVRTFAGEGEGVVLQSPDYNCFYSSVRNSGRTVLVNNLAYDRAARRFTIDWADLEARLADPLAKVFLLCNPQNPTGQIWSADDLARMGALAAAHGVTVIADEIHCDITAPGTTYTPYASVAHNEPNSITLVSPTKSFNIPGLQAAAVIVPDPGQRARVAASLNRDEIVDPGAFAVEATIAAYSAGAEWLDALREYVWGNRRFFEAYVAERLPELVVIPAEATYLVWVDCGALGADSDQFAAFLREQTGLFVNPGGMYGDNTRTFIRVNLACPRTLVEDGLARLAAGVAKWQTRA